MGPKQDFDAFLPSGAVDDILRLPHYSRQTVISPNGRDRSPRRLLPDYIPMPSSTHGSGSHTSPPPANSYMTSPNYSNNAQPLSYFSPQGHNGQSPSGGSGTPSLNGPPISPPVSRSASSDGTTSNQIDYWRAHVQKIREQSQGERAHMIADRERAEEVMAEERALWEEERALLKRQIQELEEQVATLKRIANPAGMHSIYLGNNGASPPNGDAHVLTPHVAPPRPIPAAHFSGSIDGTLEKAVPQETGRRADGSALWAPAQRNPSRTFESTDNDSLKVGDMFVPGETPIVAASKELKSSDFEISTPPAGERSPQESVSSELPVDISQIHGSLDGILLKPSAVKPEFIQMVHSPQETSPKKKSPTLHPVTALQPMIAPEEPNSGTSLSGSRNQRVTTLEILSAPEDHRLTRHAGHTPKPSVTNFDDLSGGATPVPAAHQVRAHMASEEPHQPELYDGIDDGDVPLKGQLGLENNPERDNRFLDALTRKLSEAALNRPPPSPSVASTTSEDRTMGYVGSQPSSSNIERRDSLMSRDDDDEDDPESIDEMPKLRVKSSTNFGRPFGSL